MITLPGLPLPQSLAAAGGGFALIVLVTLIGTLVAIAVTGVSALWAKNSVAATIWAALNAILILVALLAECFWVLPQAERIFMDFGVELTVPGRFALQFSHLQHNYWYLTIPASLLFTACCLAGFYLLHRHQLRWLACLLWGILSATACLFVVSILAATLLDLTKLLNDLA